MTTTFAGRASAMVERAKLIRKLGMDIKITDADAVIECIAFMAQELDERTAELRQWRRMAKVLFACCVIGLIAIGAGR